MGKKKKKKSRCKSKPLAVSTITTNNNSNSNNNNTNNNKATTRGTLFAKRLIRILKNIELFMCILSEIHCQQKEKRRKKKD